MSAKKITGKHIKVPPKIMVAILAFMATLFLLAIYMSGKKAESYVAADVDTEIKYTEVNVHEGSGPLRGALFYAKDSFVGKDARLIGNNPVNKKLWHSHGPEIDFNNEPHAYTLNDLKPPFAISKKSGSDTLVVVKDTITFLFRLETSSGN